MLLTFVRKECQHIWRDQRTLLIVFAMPITLVILFGFILSNDIKNIGIAVLDNAHDELSTGLVQKLTSSGYFRLRRILSANDEIEQAFRDGSVRLAVVIPPGFAEQFYREQHAPIQLIADATDVNTATTFISHASAIIAAHQQSLAPEIETLPFEVTVKMLYNPEMNAIFMFVPGVLSLIMMIVSAMMTSVSLAKEKECGTLRMLTVSPLSPMIIILGKVIPYLALSVVNAQIILFLSARILGMPNHGNLLHLFAICLLFIFNALSLGILIASMVATQQEAIMVSMTGLFMPTMLLSGFIFPIENMPKALQLAANTVPAKWFISALKSIMIKGAGLMDVWRSVLVLVGLTTIFLAVSLIKFRQRPL